MHTPVQQSGVTRTIAIVGAALMTLLGSFFVVVPEVEAVPVPQTIAAANTAAYSHIREDCELGPLAGGVRTRRFILCDSAYLEVGTCAVSQYVAGVSHEFVCRAIEQGQLMKSNTTWEPFKTACQGRVKVLFHVNWAAVDVSWQPGYGLMKIGQTNKACWARTSTTGPVGS